MAKADFGSLMMQDEDVGTLIHIIKNVLNRYGAFFTMRIVASVLAPYKRRRFEEKLEVKESRTMKFAGIPSDLTLKDIDSYDNIEGLDHTILWQQHGKLRYLTSEPYFVSKADLKSLIVHCDAHGIDFQIDAESCYYPGHTIRILFKKGIITPYDALKQMHGEQC